MTDSQPLILIASISDYEAQLLQRALERAGRAPHKARDAGEAARACSRHDGASVLVIDSGLLAMAHDPQWRLLQSRYPQLGVVVRALIRPGSIRQAGENTFLVHPDDESGMCRAIGLLCTPGASSG